MISRRTFLKAGGTSLGVAALSGAFPFDLSGFSGENKRSFGFQVWTIKDDLFKNFKGTLAKMAKMGYKEVEMCSPLGYSGTGFEVFNPMSGTEMRKIIESTGLTCQSSHFTMGELRENLDNRIEWSKQIGLRQIIASSFWLPENASIDDYRKACDELNIIGRKIKNAGLDVGFHNHHMEFEKRNNELIYDAMMSTLDPDIVKMQFQVAVISIGYKAADYFRKYPGRFISAHLADWSPEKKEQVPIGQGAVDWKDFFEAAKTGGVKNFFVEMAPEMFPASAAYLKKI